MSLSLDNLVPLHGRLNKHQYAGWKPTRLAESGLGCRVDSDVRIPVADGVRLSADVYRPARAGRYPAIVQLAAYNKELHAAGVPQGTNEVGSPPVLTDRGYVQVLASRRGMGRSEGESGVFLDEQELDDYVQAIAWAAEQPWCNGQVCLFGTSYYAMAQPLVALRRPPALRALFAHEFCTDYFRHLAYFAGSVNNQFFTLWLGANFKDEDYQKKLSPLSRAVASQVLNRDFLWPSVVHPNLERVYSSFFRMKPSRPMRAFLAELLSAPRDREHFAMPEGPYRRLSELTLPFVAVQNQAQWNIHQYGAFDLFERAGTPEGSKYLIVSEHEYELPVLSWQLEALAFFDHVLKGCDNGYDRQAPVRYWVEGGGRFEASRSFPPAETKPARLYLSGPGEGAQQLTARAPSEGSSRWTAVPRSAPLPPGMDEVMPQSLCFELEVSERKVLAGPLTVQLRFSCTELDSYVVAALSRVDAGGQRHLLALGAMRPAQRTVDEALSSRFEVTHDPSKLEPLRPGEEVTLRFSLVPAAAELAPGEKLRLELASRTDLLRGNLADGYVHFDLEVPPYFSGNTVHHGPESWLELHWR